MGDSRLGMARLATVGAQHSGSFWHIEPRIRIAARCWCSMTHLTAGKIGSCRGLMTTDGKCMTGSIMAQGTVETTWGSPCWCRVRRCMRVSPTKMTLCTRRGVSFIRCAMFESVGIATDPISCMRRMVGIVVVVVAFDTTRCEAGPGITAAMTQLTVRHS